MKRYIKSDASNVDDSNSVRTYQNRKNENKFIETKKYNDGHSVARQYMKWDTPEGEVKNYMGSKSNRGRWFRAGQHTRDMMLEDYDEITSSYDVDYGDHWEHVNSKKELTRIYNKSIDKKEYPDFDDWFHDMTRHGIIVESNSMD